jgi:hypothetical protein
MLANNILAQHHGVECFDWVLSPSAPSIAISPAVLRSDANRILMRGMRSWRSSMRELSAEARLHLYARSLSRRGARGFHVAALYSAFAIIAAVVFGTSFLTP